MRVSAARLEALRRRLPERREEEAPDQPLNIVDFAAHYLGKKLFPRQATLLKVMALALEHLTPFDERVIAEWTAGFELADEAGEQVWAGSEGTPGDLMERMRAARAQGHIWFRDVLLLVGRRGSKGHLGAIFGAWVLWWLLDHDDPHGYFGIDRAKRIVLVVFAGNRDQATRNQFRDLKTTIMEAPCFDAFHPMATKESLVLFTRAQITAGVDVGDREQALVEIRAAETTQLGARGPAVLALFLDEFAHVVGAGSTASSTEIYESAVPATEQFGVRAVSVQTTSPWDKQGQPWLTYRRACAVDQVTGGPLDPTLLMVQLPSWALYEDYEHAGEIEMWPGGPRFTSGLRPVLSYSDRLSREEAANPDSFAIEYRAQWRSSLAAYLPSRFVDRIFAPYKGRRLEMQTAGRLSTLYVAHGDPSLSQANFGFAIAHLELDERGIPHVVFDLLHHWRPSEFADGVVNYLQIEDEIFDLVKAFGIQTLTFDRWNSAEVIQRLRRRSRQAELPKGISIFERSPTAALNWAVAEVFKTALGHDIIHAPHDALADAELRSLELRNGKVCTATSGDVVTKDLADAMMWTVYTILGERSTEIFDQLASLPLHAATILKPVPPHVQPDSDADVMARMSAVGRQRSAHGAVRGPISNRARGRGVGRRYR
ncbi:MAG: hypothetical protein JJU45_11985 [Acidimicrobiia bacterium]|nr:hypothetical protein [Acidimicrobiia bacterium]